MDCQEYLARYSDVLDGRAGALEAAQAHTHAVGCASCARYDRVMRQGLELVRQMPGVAPAPDFNARLHRRLFLLRDDEGAERFAALSAVAALGIAALIALAAWTPMLAGNPFDETAVHAVTHVEDDVLDDAGRETDVFPTWWSAGVATMLVSAEHVIQAGLPEPATVFPGPYSPLIVSPPARGGAIFLIHGTE